MSTGGLTPVADVGVGRGKALLDALRLPAKHISTEAMVPQKVSCICEREVKMVLCRSCGMTFKGRVRQRCKLHPNNIHLMDHNVCPNCKATQLLEFTEMADKRDC